MEIRIHGTGNNAVAEIISDGIVLQSPEDAGELIYNCRFSGADTIALLQEQLPPAFFDLKTRLAGEILQKFSTYDARLAVIGDFSAIGSQSLRDFIRESNRTRRIIFVSSLSEAVQRFSE